jgi:undecaprenyl-diphosphatase
MNLFEIIKDYDKQLFLFFNKHHNEFFDAVMLFSSGKLSWLPLYLVLLLLIIKNYPYRQLPLILIGIAAAITMADQASVHLFKNVFLRYRPCHNLEIQHLVHVVKGCGGQYGFVSSHAANSFALATLIGLLLINKLESILLLLWFWALWVSYSRIYNGVHYPADIIGGAILGILIGYAVFALCKRYMARSNTIKE